MQTILPSRPAVSNRFVPHKMVGAALVATWLAAMMLAYIVVGCPSDHEVQVRFAAPATTGDLAQLEATLGAMPSVDRWHYNPATATVTIAPKTGHRLIHSNVRAELAKCGLIPEAIAFVHPVLPTKPRMLN